MRRAWIEIGLGIRDARVAKRWSVAGLPAKAKVSKSVVYLLEAGESASLEAAIRVGAALGLQLDIHFTDPKRRTERPLRTLDAVHSLMGEFEAGHFRKLGFACGLDEPYQHYQYAGRADFIAWDVEARALLHIENRTRFPDFQEAAGSFNAKRAYLGRGIADRLGLRGWASETHVMAALWSAEVLHSLRMRAHSFQSLSPNSVEGFSAWWSGTPPASGTTTVIVLLDPLANGRQRRFVDLQDALTGARPRYRGYADVAAKIAAAA